MALPANGDLPQDGSIISRWLLDEASGARADNVGSNNLTDNNSVLSSTGPFGDTCADFEASQSESLTIADGSQSGLDLSTDFSFAAWVNIEIAPGIYSLMSKASPDQYRFFYRSTTKLQCDFWDGASESEVEDVTDLGTGTWVHVVVTWDISAPNGEIYVDGASVGATTPITNATAIANQSGAFALGATNGGLYFDGKMQDAVMWGLELSSAEVTSLYNSYFAAGVSEMNLNRTPIRGVGRGIMRP